MTKTWKQTLRRAIGGTLLLILPLLLGCESVTRNGLAERPVYIPVELPESLLADCEFPPPPEREGMQNKAMPKVEDALRTAIELCLYQQAQARKYNKEQVQQIKERNKP